MLQQSAWRICWRAADKRQGRQETSGGEVAVGAGVRVGLGW